MKNLVLFGIFVLLLVAVQFAGGQTIDEIIEKHIRAKGGFENIDAIRNMYMEGLLTIMGITVGIKISKTQNLIVSTPSTACRFKPMRRWSR